VAVALGAIFTREFGAASFFLFAAATLTGAIIYGLSQKSWREFGVAQAAADGAGPSAGEIRQGQSGQAEGSQA
jgi:hypothetical protein